MNQMPTPIHPTTTIAPPEPGGVEAAGDDSLLHDVLGASMAILRADMGDIRLLDAATGTFSVVAQQGFGSDFLAAGSGRFAADTAGGHAMKTRRAVAVEDVEADHGHAGDATIAAAGYRAVHAIPLLDRAGEVLGVLSVYFLETHRVSSESLELVSFHARMAAELLVRARVEADLREREERYRSLFESIDEGFCTCEMLVDDDGQPTDYRFLEVNAAFGDMTGIRPEAVGHTARELVPGLEDRWVERYARVALGGETLRFEEGSEAMERWFDVFAFPRGERRFGIVFRDITTRKRADASLRLALAAKDEFLGLVSHELRTPMTVILGMSRLLHRDVLDPETAREVAAEIGESAEELNALVESMLLLARLDHDETSRLREPILLNRAAAHVLDRHSAKDPSRRYELEVATTETLVDVQGTLLEQVIDNLVVNAAKYSDPGRSIAVVVEAGGGNACLRVLDEGAGLNEAEIAHVFEPFYRAEGARQRAAGAGLGLAVSQRIVELLGGRIWAAQRPSGGAEFGFELPLLVEDETWSD